MRRTFVFLFVAIPLLGIIVLQSAVPIHTPDSKTTVKGTNTIASPVATPPFDGHFTENLGQLRNQDVRLYLSSGNMRVGFAVGKVFLTFVEHTDRKPLSRSPLSLDDRLAWEDSSETQGVLMRISFDGSNAAEPKGRGELPYRNNYFLGNDPSLWRTGVRNYREVVYENLYDGIDLAYEIKDGRLKYEFLVSPGANPAQIEMTYEGVDRLRLDSDGGMIASTVLGDLQDLAPVAYQNEDEIECPFSLRGPSSFGFTCRGWDASRHLIIDPLVYSTYLGGAMDDDESYSIAIDSLGYAYAVGDTVGSDFPTTPGAFSTTHKGFHDIFVSKFTTGGNSLVYSTFIGSDGDECGFDIAVDITGNAYITGDTLSTDFPTTPNAFDATLNSRIDTYMVKLNRTGSSLDYSTYLGGQSDEFGWGIAVDSSGMVFVTGETHSADFPTTPGAFNTAINGVNDAFVTKLNPDSGQLVYSTYLGGRNGTARDLGYSIAVDESGNAYVAGWTNSSSFPVTPGAYDTVFNGIGIFADAFVTKLNASGSGLIYSTFLGGNDMEDTRGISIGPSGDAYVTGMTSSVDYPVTSNAFDKSLDGVDIFVTRLNDNGSALVYSTFLGGAGWEWASAIAVDVYGYAYVTGGTPSSDFPVTNDAINKTRIGGGDGFLTKLSQDGSSLVYSTYFGGTSFDEPGGIDVDIRSKAYISGSTESRDFPVTPGAYDTVLSGPQDAFVLCIETPGPPGPPDLKVSPGQIFFTPPGPVDEGVSVTVNAFVSNIGEGNANQVVVRFYDGPPSQLDQIGSDVIIPLIPPLGSWPATTSWVAELPPGVHDICVFADPDNTIFELNESNNQACAPIEVLVVLMPDLSVSSLDMILSPPPPYVEGSLVQINATIWNIGGNVSGATTARFHDGVPPSPQIGLDQPIASLPVGGAGNVSVTWMTSPPGNHELCVVADPDNLVAEMNETNNIACISAAVLSLADLIVRSLSIAPPSPLLDGTNSSVDLTISNEGDVSTGGFDVLLFDDSDHDGTPDAGESIDTITISDLAGHSQTGVPFVWTATPTGDHDVCGFADPPPGKVDESNETNNVACIFVTVQQGPVTRPDYTPVQPNPSATVEVGLSASLSLSIRVTNMGNATASTDAIVAFYNETTPTTPFDSFTLAPLSPLGTSSVFAIVWLSPAVPGTYKVSADVDHYDNVTEWDETNNIYTWTIDVVTGPITSLVVGSPNYTSTVTYVRSATPLSLSVFDQGGIGINHTKYRIDNISWIEYSSSFFLPGEGEHYVEWYSEDKAGNVEAVNSRILRADDSPPATTLSIGDPKYTVGGDFVRSTTPLTLTAIDNSVGANSTFYRLWDGYWSSWREYTSPFSLAGRDGNWFVEYLSFDYLGNKETIRNETLILDDTPPTTTLSPATGPYTIDTVFTFTATDTGCGVNATRYMIDGGSWTEYSDGFTLPEGDHNVSYYSNDNLNNTEQVKWREVTVPGAPPPPSVEANYKPIVALVFAIILAAVGIWSSKKKPWKGGKDGMAVVRDFTIFSLPFVLAELATGIVSIATGHLPIPPIVGIGTAIDLVILVAGLAMTYLGFCRKAPELN